MSRNDRRTDDSRDRRRDPTEYREPEVPADPVVADEGDGWQAVVPSDRVITRRVHRRVDAEYHGFEFVGSVELPLRDAAEYALVEVTRPCLDDCIEMADREPVVEKLSVLPKNHHAILFCLCHWLDPVTGEIDQPVSTAEVQRALSDSSLAKLELSDRAVQGILADLETWIESRGRDGRVKQHRTTFDPEWVHDALKERVPATEEESHGGRSGG